jgi:hypothetical protein
MPVINSSNALVQDVQLLGRCILLQQLASDLPLCGENNAILCQDTERCSGVRDSLEGIFDLVEATLWGEDGRLNTISGVLGVV